MCYHAVSLCAHQVTDLDLFGDALLQTVDFSSLATVLNELSIEASLLDSISLPALTDAANLYIESNGGLLSVLLEALAQVTGDFSLVNNSLVFSVSVPGLGRVDGTVRIENNPALDTSPGQALWDWLNGLGWHTGDGFLGGGLGGVGGAAWGAVVVAVSEVIDIITDFLDGLLG